jgi:hypothetical protein
MFFSVWSFDIELGEQAAAGNQRVIGVFLFIGDIPRSSHWWRL